MRAVLPSDVGVVDRAGVPISFEVFEKDAPTLLFIPPAPITHSRIFKCQIPHLSRHYRIVAMDGRGNGGSERPVPASSHSRAENMSDILTVLDETGTDRAVLVAHCSANWWVAELAVGHPDRVSAWVAIAPGVPYVGPSLGHWVEQGPHWDVVADDPQGWGLFNRHTIETRHRDWVEFFFGQQLVEEHSTKQWEDAVAWALESTGPVLAAGEEGIEIDMPDRDDFIDALASLDMPTLVVHGDRDVCQSVARGRALADLVGGDLVVVEGAGHLALVRDPVRVNLAISDFLRERRGRL